MNTIDVANISEQTRGSWLITGPEVLADRSLGHALPAIAVFMAVGYPSDSPDVVSLISFFKNYLAARQLHDDAHDWKDDLLRGRVNGVAARMFAILEEENIDPGSISNPELEKFFWHTALPCIVDDILDFLSAARISLGRIGVIEDAATFESLLARLEVSARRTLEEQRDAVNFLELYSSVV